MTKSRSYQVRKGSGLVLGIALLALCPGVGCGLLPDNSGRTVRIVLEADRSDSSAATLDTRMDRTVEILQKRIRDFGLRRARVARDGTDRVVVEVQLRRGVPPERALLITEQTGLLEFKLVKQAPESRAILEQLKRALARQAPRTSESPTADSAGAAGFFDDLIGSDDIDQRGGVEILEEDFPKVTRFLSEVNVDSILPPDASIGFSAQPEVFDQGRIGRVLYILNRKAEMTGDVVSSAVMKTGLDPRDPSGAGISITMTKEGASTFRRVTGASIGRQLAILLDGKVYSAPIIRDRIPTGNAQITGRFSASEASDLAIALRSGAIPVRLRVVEVVDAEKSAAAPR